MDGTGKLFEPILGSLPPDIDVEVITLSSPEANDIQSQAIELAELIGQQEVVIFAESYSGAIAYRLAQVESTNIKHIVFAASFLARPSYLSKLSFLVPLSALRLNLVPSFILSWLFFDSYNRNDLVELFKQALKLVSNRTLKNRLKTIASLAEPKQQIKVPCTYIQALNDKLVNPNSVTVFQKLCVNLSIKKISGGHFIAQSSPEKCAEVVIKVSDL